MNHQSNQCPNCGKFTMVSGRLVIMLVGFAAFGCGVWLLIIPPIGLGVMAFGAATFALGIFANGTVCTSCKYSSKRGMPAITSHD